MRLLEGQREATSWAVARPMPPEPLVMRTVLFLMELRVEGSTVKVDMLDREFEVDDLIAS